MEKTFREVIRDIKDGEVWKSKYRTITSKNDEIKIELESSAYVISFNKDIKYKLQRKEYSFEEAFKSYEEGKEIESCVSGCEYKDEYNFEEPTDTVFTTGEIRGRWYIHD